MWAVKKTDRQEENSKGRPQGDSRTEASRPTSSVGERREGVMRDASKKAELINPTYTNIFRNSDN